MYVSLRRRGIPGDKIKIKFPLIKLSNKVHDKCILLFVENAGF